VQGVASVREWGTGSDGGVFFQNGSLHFKPVAMQIRAELAEAKLGIVDLELGPEAWRWVALAASIPFRPSIPFLSLDPPGLVLLQPSVRQDTRKPWLPDLFRGLD